MKTNKTTYVQQETFSNPVPIIKGSISVQYYSYHEYIIELSKLIKFMLPGWLSEARFNSEKINIYIVKDYLNMDSNLIEKNIRPFLFIAPFRNDNFLPKGFVIMSEIEISYSKKLEDQDIFEKIQNELKKIFSDKNLIESEQIKYKEAFKYQWKLGQGDGLFKSFTITFDNYYYGCFFAISFDYYYVVA